jgi:glycosyltransferase involved in cell wall biosynthesis
MRTDTTESPETARAEKPRLLVVPHLFTQTIRVREIELARRLTKYFDVHCLKWNDAFFADSDCRLKEWWQRVRIGLQTLVTKTNITIAADGIKYVEIPMVQALVLKNLIGNRLAVSVARAYNTRVLVDVASKLNITHLLLASGHFHVPSSTSGLRIFCDIVDWFDEEHSPDWILKSTEMTLQTMAREAKLIFAVSPLLSEGLFARYGIQSDPFPNGADVAGLRAVPAEKVADVRRRWGITGRFVIGYIGNHGSFAGVDFILRVHQLLRKRIPDAVLFIVGPAGYWKSMVKHRREEGVIFTGAIDPTEINTYFNAIDIGLLAQAPNLGTNYAFQIKMVEYAASRKFAISTPLEVWKKMAWPNVSLVELDEQRWVDAIEKARSRRWCGDWDYLVESYDWQVIADRVAHSILAASEAKEAAL